VYALDSTTVTSFKESNSSSLSSFEFSLWISTSVSMSVGASSLLMVFYLIEKSSFCMVVVSFLLPFSRLKSTMAEMSCLVSVLSMLDAAMLGGRIVYYV
jgi:hypothetical protein